MLSIYTEPASMGMSKQAKSHMEPQSLRKDWDRPQVAVG